LATVPVTRAADLAKMGIGKIYIEEEDLCRVIGVGTKFTKQCMIKGQLVLPKDVGYAQGEITEIISDTELR
jgi:glycerol-3-phosphate O-acyltransferase/dihydroxyacetone phosphate acyltransferase